MDWPGVAVVAAVFFVIGYAFHGMRSGGGDDSLKLNVPIRSDGLAATVASDLKAKSANAKADALTPEVREQIEDLILRNKKIEAIKAIKMYREATKVRLEEAKNAVEAMQRQLMNPGGSA